MNEMIERLHDRALSLGFQATEEDIRLLIMEMREPTKKMAKAGAAMALSEGAHDCEVPMSSVWQAMIDAVLEK